MDKTYYNYLNTLPNRKKLEHDQNNEIRAINKILSSKDNTDDYILLNFRYQLIDILINKILKNKLNIENYHLLRNNLIILDESLIKLSSNELVNLINQDNDKICDYIKILNEINNFKYI